MSGRTAARAQHSGRNPGETGPHDPNRVDKKPALR
jgi:hypothetical protein